MCIYLHPDDQSVTVDFHSDVSSSSYGELEELLWDLASCAERGYESTETYDGDSSIEFYGPTRTAAAIARVKHHQGLLADAERQLSKAANEEGPMGLAYPDSPN